MAFEEFKNQLKIASTEGTISKVFQDKEEAILYCSFIQKALESIGINKNNFAEDQRLCVTFNKNWKSLNLSFGSQNWLILKYSQDYITLALLFDFLKGYDLILPNEEKLVENNGGIEYPLMLQNKEIQLASVNKNENWYFQGKRFDKKVVLSIFQKKDFSSNLEVLQNLFIQTLQYAESFSRDKIKRTPQRRYNNNSLIESIFELNGNTTPIKIIEEVITPFQLEEILENTKKIIIKEAVQREGQDQFRSSLLKAYSQKCCISNCQVLEVLEAAHIVPYSGIKSNHVQNGLLLRADLHKLFDNYLMSIEPNSFKLKVHKNLKNSEYNLYAEKSINSPANSLHNPSLEALKIHYEEFLKHNEPSI
jgi:HNH endonuclease